MRLIVITGPPCAGKTTYAREHAQPETDIVIDLDTIAHALGYPHEHIDPNRRDHPAVRAALRARASILNEVSLHRSGRGTAWLIDTNGSHTHQAEHVVHLDPGPEVCHQRADTDGRAPGTHHEIDAWHKTRRKAP